MDRRAFMLTGTTAFLSGCVGRWEVDYEEGLSPSVTRNWGLGDVRITVPSVLKVSHSNRLAPNADIVWHGEPYGDRKAQVAAIVDEGITAGAQVLSGNRPVILSARILQFHAVTPSAVATSPGAVHNIAYQMRVFDGATGDALTDQQLIRADLEAYVGSAAVTAAIEGNTQRVRIVNHLARVTQGWLGFGMDQRRTFSSIGR